MKITVKENNLINSTPEKECWLCNEISENEALAKLGKGMGKKRKSNGGEGRGKRLKSGL